MQKEYTKPVVSRVSLIPSEAILAGCKTSSVVVNCATTETFDCAYASCYSVES